MDSRQKRKRIHEYVDQADDRFLALVSGMIDADLADDWWDQIPLDLQSSINRALAQSENGEGRLHDEVMAEMKSRYLKS